MAILSWFDSFMYAYLWWCSASSYRCFGPLVSSLGSFLLSLLKDLVFFGPSLFLDLEVTSVYLCFLIFFKNLCKLFLFCFEFLHWFVGWLFTHVLFGVCAWLMRWALIIIFCLHLELHVVWTGICSGFLLFTTRYHTIVLYPLVWVLE